MSTHHAISESSVQDVTHPTKALNDASSEPSNMKMPGFFSEEWYQPLDNGPTVWSVIRDVLRLALKEVKNFFTQNRQTSSPSREAGALKVVQAKPVYTLNSDGTPTPVWEPSTGLIQHSPFTDGSESATEQETLKQDELSEREAPTRTDALDNLDDINAWISANISEAPLAWETSIDETVDATQGVDEDDSLQALQQELNHVQEAVVSQVAPAEIIEDAVSIQHDVTFVNEEEATVQLDSTLTATELGVVNEDVTNDSETTAISVTYSDVELERLNQEQNQELNALINRYFSNKA
jgi:hypothetical protein